VNLLDIIFPKKCVGCNKFGSLFCADCISSIKQDHLVCPKCERPSIGGAVHPVCRRKFGLDGLWSLGVYENPLRKAIQKLKYKKVPVMAEILVNITLEYWAKYRPFIFDEIKKNPENWVLVPVPLHWWRENSRGFNQSDLYGKLLSKSLGLDYCNAIKRIRYTRQQVGLKGSERNQNIRGAFEVTEKQIGKNILLIDDVWTTGSTLRECTYMLKRSGVKKVWALTLAR
jgi:ComF family protein